MVRWILQRSALPLNIGNHPLADTRILKLHLTDGDDTIGTEEHQIDLGGVRPTPKPRPTVVSNSTESKCIRNEVGVLVADVFKGYAAPRIQSTITRVA